MSRATQWRGISLANDHRQARRGCLDFRVTALVSGHTTTKRERHMDHSTQAANAWRILFLLFLANLFNFFDRTIPAIIIEPIRKEWSLSDFQLGIIGTAFTIVYAIAGLPLGRMADTGSRSKLM